MLQFSEFVNTYGGADLIKIIASLQLLPRNHGKNERLEAITRITVANLKDNSISIPISELENIIREEYPESEQEDPPVNLFTENIMFFGGNYVVFPGITENGTSVLNNLLKTIFSQEHKERFPKSFTENVYSGTVLMLNLFNKVVKDCGLKRNIYERELDNYIKFPRTDQIENLKKSITFSEDWIYEHCKDGKIQKSIIDKFVISPKDSSLLEDHPSKSPLRAKPLLKVGDEYILIQPMSSVDCLIKFIWVEAKENKCDEGLLAQLNDIEWQETLELFMQMQWFPTEVSLPDAPNKLCCKETVVGFDLNKLAYICFFESGFEHSFPSEGKIDFDNPPKKTEDYGDLILNRQKTVLSHLSQEFGQEFEFLTLYIVSEVGFLQQFSIPDSSEDKLTLWFRYTELKHLVELEESDPLLLWKFAKAYTEVSTECEFVHTGEMLNVFACYKKHGYTFWHIDKERPEAIGIMPGYSGQYVFDGILKRDEHLALCSVEKGLGYKIVYNYCNYAPFYTEVGYVYAGPILLEDFAGPIWFINGQHETHHEILISMQLEMLAFWTNKLRLQIEQYFTFLEANNPLMVNVHLDKRFKREMRPYEIPVVSLENISIPIEINNNHITLTIPLELLYWYSLPDNEGERHLIFNFLNTIILAKTGFDRHNELSVILDEIIPKGKAKMCSVLGNTNNLQLENRFLPAYRSIQEYNLSYIKVNLTRGYGVQVNQNDLISSENKNNLCKGIAKVLYEKVLEKLSQFDPHELLPILISLNEACVQKRAEKALDIPARISCFGSYSKEIFNLFQKEQDRAKTALAARCLIEIIVANDPIKGIRPPNFDELDELLALMHEMISWGTLSDGIYMGLYNPTIKLLACGRIDVDYASLNSDLIPFWFQRTKNEVDAYTSGYEEFFAKPDNYNFDQEFPPEVIAINQAFKNDWGIEFTNLHEFILDLVEFTRANSGSVVGIDESIMYEKFRNTKFKWSDEQITAALNALTLTSGWQIGLPPSGYKKADTFPWHYNRALSFLRRPIAKLVKGNRTYYYWSYRHLLASFDNLVMLLFDGRLVVFKGGLLHKLVGEYGNKKGKRFRNKVAEWLTENTRLQVFKNEFFINSKAKLKSSVNLGDIDILAVDKELRIVYSIECKNTVSPKAIHEMKTEIDNYLGRDGNKGMVRKHINRDKWLKNNKNKLAVFITNPEQYEIKSIVITSEEIPLPYLKGNVLPMPIISFRKLKMTGIELLDNNTKNSIIG